MSSIPTAELRTAAFLSEDYIRTQEMLKFVASCKLRMLELEGWNYEPKGMFSSPTLSHLNVSIWPICPILGQLPNLVHLRLHATMVQGGKTEVIWPPLPLLISLDISIPIGLNHELHLKRILQGTRQLVALQILDLDAPEAINFFLAQSDTNDSNTGVGGRWPRLVRVIVRAPVSAKRLDKLESAAQILHGQRPHVQTEWYTRPPDNLEREWCPVVLDGVESKPLGRGKEPSPPLSWCADEIIGRDRM